MRFVSDGSPGATRRRSAVAVMRAVACAVASSSCTSGFDLTVSIALPVTANEEFKLPNGNVEPCFTAQWSFTGVADAVSHPPTFDVIAQSGKFELPMVMSCDLPEASTGSVFFVLSVDAAGTPSLLFGSATCADDRERHTIPGVSVPTTFLCDGTL